MIEFTSTRANLLVDPFLHVWGWEIPVYLFLGGLAAGLLIYFVPPGDPTPSSRAPCRGGSASACSAAAVTWSPVPAAGS